MFNHGEGTVDRARQLRQQMSLPEALLWRELKPRPMGLKFRNQHPLGNFVVDFYCHAARVAVEIDGAAHDMGDQPEFDLQRDASLTASGIRMIRIPAKSVLLDPAAVAESIVLHCLSVSAPTGAPH